MAAFARRPTTGPWQAPTPDERRERTPVGEPASGSAELCSWRVLPLMLFDSPVRLGIGTWVASQISQPGAVGTHDVDLEVPITGAGEGDLLAAA
jgi:hypothetical protein